MKKLMFMLLTIVVLASCKKEDAIEPVKAVLPQAQQDTFNIKDYDKSLWLLKGYWLPNQGYVATYSDKCGCPQETGFVLNFKTDTVPFDNGKYYTYYRSNNTDNQVGATYSPIDSIFKGWPTGKSDYFQQYTVISANKDSLVISDGTPFSNDGSYAVYINRSDLLIP